MTTVRLDHVAAQLEGLEETIIHRFIDRAQFVRNAPAYERGSSGFLGEDQRSLFELRLRSQELMDAEFGRFQVPEERPFSKDLPAPRRAVALPPTILNLPHFDAVNLCPSILSAYLPFVGKLCAPGIDEQFGSSVELDVYALQAIARRIHFGAMYVAEVKFRSNAAAYRLLIKAEDRDELLRLLTRPEVEANIIKRVGEKVRYIQAHVNRAVRKLIDEEVVLEFYRDAVIPLTKEGELRYLSERVL
ncbi:MAG TPA: chorismate mutase [Spirochaetia bacterium]|nr:chorismate mutase [Spirochaetia bacterium]